VVASRHLDKPQPVADEISALGRKTPAISVDITREPSVANLVGRVREEFGRIDILVNCPGLVIRNLPENMPVEDWQRAMDFNARGVHRRTYYISGFKSFRFHNRPGDLCRWRGDDSLGRHSESGGSKRPVRGYIAESLHLLDVPCQPSFIRVKSEILLPVV
jgi:hypothetical protein